MVRAKSDTVGGEGRRVGLHKGNAPVHTFYICANHKVFLVFSCERLEAIGAHCQGHFDPVYFK